MRAFLDLCFRRPIAVTAFYVLMLSLAAVAYVRLPVALLPDLRYPTLVVWTGYPEVPPERVERAVTERIEAAVAGTQGLRRLTARSQLGGSLVRLDFGWNTNLDLALLDVREQLDRLGDALPDEAARPVVLRLDPNDRPILLIALRSTATAAPTQPDRQDLAGLKQLGREVIARRLEQFDEVARVTVTGGYERQIDVVVDPARLAAHRLSLDRIGAALRAANVALPGGMLRRGPFRYAVEVSGEFADVDEVAATVVTTAGRTPIRLRDVAEVREGLAPRRGLVRLNGAETLLLLVERRPEANTLRAAEAVRAVLPSLEAALPGVRLDVVVDESRFIEAAIGGITQALLLGGVLAILVLFGFLRRVRVLLAVAVAVPLSLALALVCFEGFGVSMNLISLSGLALGVGMLVDNAIVVVENIARLHEEGMPMPEAARAGVGEVAGAITASTLTTLAVFLPLSFVEGLAGRLFRDQSLAVVAALLASLLVALTVVPLLARTPGAVRPAASPSGAPPRGQRWGLLASYERALAWCLNHRPVVLLGAVGLLMMAVFVGLRLPREVVPRTDQGRLDLHLTLPPDADLPLVSLRAEAIERALRAGGLAAHVLSDLGERDEARLQLDPRPPYTGTLTVLLPPTLPAETAAQAIRALPLPDDVLLEVQPVRTPLENLLLADASDLLIDLIGEKRTDAEAAAAPLHAALLTAPTLTQVREAEALAVPAYRLRLRRDELARFGVTPSTLATLLEAAARGRRATELRQINEEVPIVLRTEGIGAIEELLALRVPTPEGLLPMSTFVVAEPVTLPASLIRRDQAPVVRLLADVAPGADLAAATATLAEALSAHLPPGVRGHVSGANEAFLDSLRAVGMSLLLSLVLVYLILTAQFESLVQPLVILAAVPLAAAGVSLVLWATGQTINLMSLTGCVVLVGIVVNDAIVKVDFINQRRAAGYGLRAAVEAAGHARFRPILITTLTTVLGLLPLAIGLGEGAALRAPLAIALAGGLTSATVLTLFVIPVLVTLLPSTR